MVGNFIIHSSTAQFSKDNVTFFLNNNFQVEIQIQIKYLFFFNPLFIVLINLILFCQLILKFKVIVNYISN